MGAKSKLNVSERREAVLSLLRIIILTYRKDARVFGCDISSRTALASLFFREQ